MQLNNFKRGNTIVHVLKESLEFYEIIVVIIVVSTLKENVLNCSLPGIKLFFSVRQSV